MATCNAPIPEETLLDYWAGDLADGGETERLEEHLFACGDCSARLEQLAALGTGLATLAPRLGDHVAHDSQPPAA